MKDTDGKARRSVSFPAAAALPEEPSLEELFRIWNIIGKREVTQNPDFVYYFVLTNKQRLGLIRHGLAHIEHRMVRDPTFEEVEKLYRDGKLRE